MQVVRFLKALACLGVHFYLLQYLPVEVLHSDWYYKLGIPARWASETLCSCVKWKDRSGESMLIVVSYCANYLDIITSHNIQHMLPPAGTCWSLSVRSILTFLGGMG